MTKWLPMAFVAMLVLTGCDHFTMAYVTNGCDATIDVAKVGSDYPFELAVGETMDVNSTVTFDIVVSAHGADQWDTRIEWSRIKHSADDDGVPFVIEGDDCPATRG